MKKKLWAGMAAGVMMLATSGLAHATLVGDNVTSQHYFPDIATPYGNLASAIVTNDSSDTMTPHYGQWYTVNVDAASFYVDYVDSATWTTTSFNGLIVDSLDDSSGNNLQAVAIDTNMAGWDVSRLSFDADTVYLNWNGLSFNPNTYFNVSLDFGAAPVPEPATMLLLGSGLTGLVAARRKKKA